MKVKELIELLNKYDRDLEVIMTMYSDYKLVETTDISLVTVVAVPEDGWLKQMPHYQPEYSPHLRDQYIAWRDKARSKTYLHIKGN